MGILVLFPLVLMVQAISFGLGIVIIVGAVKMMRLQSHGLARVASVMAMLPCGPAWLLGLPMGIWSLIVLSRQNVKAAFDSQATSRPAKRPPETEPGARTHGLWWVGAALALVSLICLGVWVAPAIVARWSDKGLLTIETRDAITGAKILVSRGAEQAAIIDPEIRPWVYLDPGIYQVILVSGSWNAAAGARPAKIELSSSTVTVSPGSQHVVQVFVRESEPSIDEGRTAALRHVLAPKWIEGPNGPVLKDETAMMLKLSPSQIEEVNRVLPAIYKEYLALEPQYTERRTNEAGHVVVTVKPFPGPVERLENKLWSQLDAILDVEQQSTARLNLKFDPPEARTGNYLTELVRPGFFGWGKDGAVIEIWRVGAWYHWKIRTRGYESSSREPQLPEEYRRFWTEPGDDTTQPAERSEE